MRFGILFVVGVFLILDVGTPVGDGPCKVHVIGDSVTAPVQKQITRDLTARGWGVKVDARSGRTVQEGALIASRSNADVIVLALGANRPRRVVLPKNTVIVTVEGHPSWNAWARSRGEVLDWSRYADRRGWHTKDGKHYSRTITAIRGKWIAKNITCRKG